MSGARMTCSSLGLSRQPIRVGERADRAHAVLEAAVIPVLIHCALSVPKAYVTLADGHVPDANTANSILRHVRERVSAYKRIRRIEFGLLPKTISGKIRRVDLRNDENQRPDQPTPAPQ